MREIRVMRMRNMINMIQIINKRTYSEAAAVCTERDSLTVINSSES